MRANVHCASWRALSFCALALIVLLALAACGGTAGRTSTPTGGPGNSGNGGGANGGGTGGGGAPSSTGDYVYVANKNSGVSGFALNSDGSLTAVPNSPLLASGVVTLLADPLGRFLWAESGPQLITFTVNGDGSLTQTSVVNSPQQSFAGLLAVDAQGQSVYSRNIFANNIDFNEGVQNYRVGAGGALAFQDFVYNFGTLAMAITPDGAGAYVGWGYHLDSEINEYSRSSSGTLTMIGNVFGPPDPATGFTKTIGALAMDPQGRYIFSDWGSAPAETHMYAINGDKSLSEVGTSIGSPAANHAVFDPSGNWVLVGTGSGISVFQLNRMTGMLTSAGAVNTSAINRLAFSSSGQYVIGVSPDANNVYVFAFNAQTGALTPATGSPTSTSQPFWVAVVHR